MHFFMPIPGELWLWSASLAWFLLTLIMRHPWKAGTIVLVVMLALFRPT